jgi:DNA-binding NtrC family response regulator
VREIAVAARVLAATNRELDREVAAERFREDLLYRLNVHRIRVPPLRERREDIGPLAARFVEESCRQFGLLPKTLSPEVRERLTSLDWRRNNVRELRNTVERMVALADGEMLRLEHLVVDADDGPAGDDPGTGTFQEQRAAAERRIVTSALERHDWHVTRTALALGLADHASLLKIMRRLGIRRA